MLQRLAENRWNYDTATHLLNRAGFGGTPEEIRQIASMGLDGAVSHFVDYEAVQDDFPAPSAATPEPDYFTKSKQLHQLPKEEMAAQLAQKYIDEGKKIMEMRHWWLQRMATGNRPFQEKMTLFWHGHFATSVEKVKVSYLMWLQNETLRRNALGFWQNILLAMAQDPAMLIWLDGARNNKNHPNENFAREVMELFSLGEGNYTEQDVTEGARAFTGWGLDRDLTFKIHPFQHDKGTKTFLGVTGDLDGNSVIETIVRQPQTNRYITAKIWTFFAKENPDPTFVDDLAQEFAAGRQEFKPFMRALFSSESFYAPEVINSQVKSPVQWLVGATRQLERDLPGPYPTSNMLKQLGQTLFAPPNVKGWDGGIAWINTTNLLNRYNFAAALVEGQKPAPPKRPAPTPPPSPAAGTNSDSASMMAGSEPTPTPAPPTDLQENVKARLQKIAQAMAASGATEIPPAEVLKLFSPDDLTSLDKLIAAMENHFIQGKLKPQRESILREYLQKSKQIDQAAIRHAIRLLMSTPDYQLT